MNVPHDLTSLWQSLAESADVVVISSAKAVLLLGLAGLVALAFKNASAALRHWIWSLALASVLVLLPLSLLVPSWPVAFWHGAPFSTAASGVPLPEVAPTAPPPEVAPTVPPPEVAPTVPPPNIEAAPAPDPLVLQSGTSTLVWEEAAHAAAPVEVPQSEGVVAQADVAGTDVAWADVAWEAARGMSGAAWAMLLWAIGAVAVLAYFALGTIRAWWWTWRAEPVRDEAWTSLAKDVAWMLCLKRPVRLLWSEKAAMPMVWGLFRPVVLLPKSAATWTAERRRVVLLHEMAHIQRWDPLTQALAQVACALHWCNPFVWWGARRLRVERERACDDQVITSGTKASTYASHLLAIARSLRATPGAAFGTVSMARPSQLEGRLLAILEPNLSRRTLSRARSVSTGMFFAAALVPLAAMQPWADEAGQTSEDDEAQSAFAFAFTGKVETSEAVARQTSADEQVYEKSFEVNPGGLLTIRTDRGSIEVQTHDAGRVDVKATVEDRARGRSSRTGAMREYRDLVERRKDVALQLEMEEKRRDLLMNELESVEPESVDSVTSKVGAGQEEEQLSYVARLRAGVAEKELNIRQLQVEIDALDKRIETRESGEAEDVDQTGSENFMIYFERNGDDVLVRGEQKEKRRWNWNGDRLRVKYVVTVPERFDVDLQTSGGSISVEDLEGTVETKTSGGSLSFGMIRGDITGRTSGGSISLNGTSGSADVHTSGGSISLGKVAGTVKAHTSGGSISIDEVSGTIDARTSGGSIQAALTEQPAGDSELRTSGGTITVRLADGIGLDVDAKTSAGRVTTDFDVPPREKDEMNRLDASIRRRRPGHAAPDVGRLHPHQPPERGGCLAGAPR